MESGATFASAGALAPSNYIPKLLMERRGEIDFSCPGRSPLSGAPFKIRMSDLYVCVSFGPL